MEILKISFKGVDMKWNEMKSPPAETFLIKKIARCRKSMMEKRNLETFIFKMIKCILCNVTFLCFTFNEERKIKKKQKKFTSELINSFVHAYIPKRSWRFSAQNTSKQNFTHRVLISACNVIFNFIEGCHTNAREWKLRSENDDVWTIIKWMMLSWCNKVSSFTKASPERNPWHFDTLNRSIS